MPDQRDFVASDAFSIMPNIVVRTGEKPANLKTLRRSRECRGCKRMFWYSQAGIPMVTTICADRPASSFFGSVFLVGKGHSGTHHLFKKGLDQCGHRAEPQQKDQNDMIRCHNGIDRRPERGRWGA